MWFIRFFVVAVGFALLYMLVTQETLPMLVRGEQRVYSLVHHPIRFTTSFVAFGVFEWFLLKTLAQAREEQAGRKRKKSGR